MKRGVVILSLILVSILVISGCSEFSRIMKDGSKYPGNRQLVKCVFENTPKCVSLWDLDDNGIVNVLDYNNWISRHLNIPEDKPYPGSRGDVLMSIENVDTDAGTLDIAIDISNGEPIYGFEFILHGAKIDTISGGLAQDAGYFLYLYWDGFAGDNIMMGVNLDGEPIDESGVLVNIGFSDYGGEFICFDLGVDENNDGWEDYNLLSNYSGGPIPATWGECYCPSGNNDECGVCNGDNSICSDCAGVPNGDSLVDNCGTCDSDPSNDCIQDCAGVWGGDETCSCPEGSEAYGHASLFVGQAGPTRLFKTFFSSDTTVSDIQFDFHFSPTAQTHLTSGNAFTYIYPECCGPGDDVCGSGPCSSCGKIGRCQFADGCLFSCESQMIFPPERFYVHDWDWQESNIISSCENPGLCTIKLPKGTGNNLPAGGSRLVNFASGLPCYNNGNNAFGEYEGGCCCEGYSDGIGCDGTCPSLDDETDYCLSNLIVLDSNGNQMCGHLSPAFIDGACQSSEMPEDFFNEIRELYEEEKMYLQDVPLDEPPHAECPKEEVWEWTGGFNEDAEWSPYEYGQCVPEDDENEG